MVSGLELILGRSDEVVMTRFHSRLPHLSLPSIRVWVCSFQLPKYFNLVCIQMGQSQILCDKWLAGDLTSAEIIGDAAHAIAASQQPKPRLLLDGD